jgi:hypothetical protein
MKSKILVLAILCSFCSPTLAKKEEFKGLEWLKKYRDSDGCIPLKQLMEESDKAVECPTQFEPQIRPLTIGKLNREKTESKNKSKFELCCFEWQTYGNR